MLAVAYAHYVCGKRGKRHREEERIQPSLCSKGSKAKVSGRPVKLDAKLAKLTDMAFAEELKVRIRTEKMMSQGVLYSQMVQAHAPVHVMPDPTSAPALAPARAPAPAPALTQVAPRIVRTALTLDKAIRILLDAVDRLQQ
jgi:hypothetical protein